MHYLSLCHFIYCADVHAVCKHAFCDHDNPSDATRYLNSTDPDEIYICSEIKPVKTFICTHSLHDNPPPPLPCIALPYCTCPRREKDEPCLLVRVLTLGRHALLPMTSLMLSFHHCTRNRLCEMGNCTGHGDGSSCLDITSLTAPQVNPFSFHSVFFLVFFGWKL